jgi:hypothetical protein
MRPSKQPRLSTQEQANLDRLQSLGVSIGADGAVQMDAGIFQGTADPTQLMDPDEFGSGTEVASVTHTVSPFDRLEEDTPMEALPADEAAVPEPVAPPEAHRQTEEGLAKREADARKAQQEMSKTQARLDKTLSEVNKRFADLDQHIRKLEVLQTTVGSVPTGMQPASSELVEQYRSDFPEPVAVMEAMVAPLYNTLAKLNGQIETLSKFYADTQEEKVFSGVYKAIPKARVEEITQSVEFSNWLADIAPAIRNLYIKIMNETSNYSAEDALNVFSHFAKDTGIDVGLGRSATVPPPVVPAMDRAPSLRSGSALPRPVETQARNTNQNELRPLTMLEAQNFGRMIRDAQTNEERDILTKRLNLTQLNVDGRQAREFR